jgi:hypothetical protein
MGPSDELPAQLPRLDYGKDDGGDWKTLLWVPMVLVVLVVLVIVGLFLLTLGARCADFGSCVKALLSS